MLYIFDVGNVIVNLDFTRALGVWSNLSGTPLAHVQQHFQLGPQVERHERGKYRMNNLLRHCVTSWR